MGGADSTLCHTEARWLVTRSFTRIGVTALLVTMAMVTPALAQFAKTPNKPPTLDAKLTIGHGHVAPGGASPLAISLDIPSGWHIYSPILLDTGLPTEVHFELPDGFSVEPVRFPTPYLGEAAELEYLGYSGAAVLLTTLHVADDAAAGKTHTLRAKVSALVCQDNGSCIPVEANAKLDVPIDAAPAERVNAELFEQAADELPKPLAEAPYLGGSRLIATHRDIPIGATGELILELKVQAGHHVNDREPGAEGLIPTRLFVEQVDGVTFDYEKQRWPTPQTSEIEFIGKVRHQSGDVVVRTPFTISDKNFTPGPVRLRALIQYQTCTDAGQCFAPAMAEAEVTFHVVPADAAAVRIDDPLVTAATSTEPNAGPRRKLPPLGTILLVLINAFIGGIILNVMPCVLPVISLKIFGFIQQAGESPARRFALGVTYGLGILASFAVIGGLMAFFLPGEGWGTLIMQNPTAIIALSVVVVAFGLSMLGVFEFQLPGFAMNAASDASSREGFGGAFFHGVLATALATPCTAPFLGAALGALASMPRPLMFAGILTVGIGLAFPYVLLTAVPGWVRFIPKPGPWMVTLKEIMGFVLLAVPLWLLAVLQHLDEGLLFVGLSILLGVGVACWLIGRITPRTSTAGAWGHWLSAISVICVAWLAGDFFFNFEGKIDWQAWEPGIAQRLADQGDLVYVDYTASWCLTCQTNKRAVLETDTVSGRFQELGVTAIKADFTSRDSAMLAELQAHDRLGVPLNLIYPRHRPDTPIVLPEVLTTSLVLDALDDAAQSSTPAVESASLP